MTRRPSPVPAWVLLIGALACKGAPGDPDNQPTPEGPPATAHWMADTFADRPDTALGQILLPGAFNSSSYACEAEFGMSPDAPDVVAALWGSDDSANEEMRNRILGWAKTQDRSIGQQLEDGIRFVELNLTRKEGAIVTWHSVYGVPVDVVLDDLVDFAVAWPDEVVLVSFGLSLDSADWPQFADALVAPRADGASFCDRVYDGPEEAALATLADVRTSGRNLIWAPDGELRGFLEDRGDCPLSTGGIDRVWSITATTEGVEEALAGAVATRDPERVLINDFVFSLDGAATTGEQAEFILGYSGVQEASLALGFSGDFPGRLIATHNTQGAMNIFAGAYYQDTDLVEAAIAANQSR